MKNLILLCLLTFPVYFFSQSISLDKLFKKLCDHGIMFETQANKLQFDTSEAIILKGYVVNCSKSDSILFTVVPTTPNYNLVFTFSGPLFSTQFSDYDLRAQNIPLKCEPTSTKIAPGERIEVFSINLKDTYKHWFPNSAKDYTEYIQIWGGLYEFSWKCGINAGISKPLYLEIK